MCVTSQTNQDPDTSTLQDCRTPIGFGDHHSRSFRSVEIKVLYLPIRNRIVQSCDVPCLCRYVLYAGQAYFEKVLFKRRGLLQVTMP